MILLSETIFSIFAGTTPRIELSAEPMIVHSFIESYMSILRMAGFLQSGLQHPGLQHPNRKMAQKDESCARFAFLLVYFCSFYFILQGKPYIF